MRNAETNRGHEIGKARPFLPPYPGAFDDGAEPTGWMFDGDEESFDDLETLLEKYGLAGAASRI